MTSAQLVPVLVVPFIAWRLYSRARRHIGRQRLQSRALVVGIVIFSVVSVLLGVASFEFPQSLLGLVGGLLLGVPLALLGLRLTSFEKTEEGKFYTPNTYFGISIVLLLVGRIMYRMIVLSMVLPNGQRPASVFQSPFTLVVFGLTAGYYIAYNSGVLSRAKKLDTESSV